MAAYVYQPLENRGSIRILELKPATARELELECEILEYKLEESSSSATGKGPVRTGFLVLILIPEGNMTDESA